MKTNHRTLLKTVRIIGPFSVVPRKVLDGNGFISPSGQLTKEIIDVGGVGKPSYHFTSSEVRKLVSVYDVDRKYLQQTVDLGKKKLGTTLIIYHDFRDLIRDPNVDIVHIATPPHWHALMATEAARVREDVWCEKPMTRTTGEGRKVVEAMQHYNHMFRSDTWFRFTDTFYGLGTTVQPLEKLMESGMLGWPLKVVVSGATGFIWKSYWVDKDNLQPQLIPQELDYDMWLGSAPFKPYDAYRVHQAFRGYWNYDGSGLTDTGQHYLDPIQYFLGKDNTSLVKAEMDVPQQHYDTVGIWRKITYTYADGCQIVLEGEGYESKKRVPYIESPKGKMYKGSECAIPDVMNGLAEFPDSEPQNADFLDCIRTREKFALDKLDDRHSCALVNMATVTLRSNRKELAFDPKTQLFIGDDAANALTDQPVRKGWDFQGLQSINKLTI